MTVCDRIGITEEQFYEAIPTFKGVYNASGKDGRKQPANHIPGLCPFSS